MDFETQRKNMVDSQVRPSDIADRRIVRAMLEIPREAFVPLAARALAYKDADLRLPPTAKGQPARALLAPRTLAKLLELASIDPGDAVLDVGCASGYSAAVLSRLAGSVVALESDQRLADEARKALQNLGIGNVSVVVGELSAGHAPDGPYDVIVLEGAVPSLPEALAEQLKDGGRMVGVLQPAGRPLGRAVVWRRFSGTVSEASGFDAGAPPLVAFEAAPTFVF